jgi:hypothetical protein
VSILQIQEAARHQLSTTATVSAGVGAATLVQPIANKESRTVLPTGVVSYAERVRAIDNLDAGTLTLSETLAPVVNINTGLPSPNLQTNTSLMNPVAPTVIVSVAAGLSKSVPFFDGDHYPLTALNGGLDVRFRVTPQIDVALGVSGFWQQQRIPPSVGATPGTTAAPQTTTMYSETGYVSVTARAPTLRF